MITTLITVAAIAWLSQLVLGGWQLHQFNLAFDALCQKGRVGIGRSGGRFKPRVVIAIALDEHNRVCDSLMLRGLTIFARPVKIPAINGTPLQQLQPDVIFPHDSRCQNALSLALKLKHG
ncbi:transcriptional regulator GutM [Pseudescherichia vulneris]